MPCRCKRIKIICIGIQPVAGKCDLCIIMKGVCFTGFAVLVAVVVPVQGNYDITGVKRIRKGSRLILGNLSVNNKSAVRIIICLSPVKSRFRGLSVIRRIAAFISSCDIAVNYFLDIVGHFDNRCITFFSTRWYRDNNNAVCKNIICFCSGNNST